MGNAEHAGQPEPPEAKILQFGLIQGEDEHEFEEFEFEESFWLSAVSDDNRRFIENKSKEWGVSPIVILDAALESYVSLYGVFERGYRTFYETPDGRLHPMDEDPDQPKAV